MPTAQEEQEDVTVSKRIIYFAKMALKLIGGCNNFVGKSQIAMLNSTWSLVSINYKNPY
jgi:hypothetical protein